MHIQKYSAKIKGTDTEVIGYITEIREYLSNGCYSKNISYLISVNSISMPGGKYGSFIVEKDSIKKITE